MIETVAEHCKHKDCAYRMSLGHGRSVTPFCAYCMLTGHRRESPISECDKYVKGKRRPKKDRGLTVLEYEVVK